jgi:hypothetical protein
MVLIVFLPWFEADGQSHDSHREKRGSIDELDDKGAAFRKDVANPGEWFQLSESLQGSDDTASKMYAVAASGILRVDGSR